METSAGMVIDKSTRTLSSIFSSTWTALGLHIAVIFLVFLRVVCIIWTARDIIHRTNSFSLQVISILLVTFLTPFVGLPLYFLVRPISFKKDRIPRREACASSLVECYNCHTLNPKEYVCCVACGERLKIKCKECGNSYPHSFGYCNICGAPNID